MVAAILFLILIAIKFGVGFAVKALLWIAIALFALWIVGWVIGAGSAGSRRWYYW
jgi:hypothetical protein